MSPECLSTDGFATDIHGQHLEEGVGFVIPAAQSEEERLEDAVCQGLGDNVLDICRPEFAGCDGVVEEGWHFRRDFLKDILWRVNRKIGKVFFGEVDDQTSELTELVDTMVSHTD